jgi:sugar/nucleoside kinase (ribokinase family)
LRFIQYCGRGQIQQVFDIVSVGHFSIDSIYLPDRQTPFVVLGGSVAYVSLAARRLESRVAVVSKVGGDFPEAYRWWLGQEGINLSRLIKVENAQTTHFELKYNADLSDRTLTLKSRAPPITVDDLPNPLKASAIHIAPIAGEITCEIVERLKECADVLSLDPQGLVRNFDENGNVTHGSLADLRMLDLINIYKSSQNEIEAVTGLSELNSAIKAVHDHGVRIVLVTLGTKGAVLSAEGTRYDIPPCKPEKFTDPTGAGDAFIGGFLTEYVNGENILRCACVGVATASFVVEGIGPTLFGDKTQVYQRARELYEKEIKQ